MPYVSVHIDEDDVLDDMSVDEIKRYLERRIKDDSSCVVGPTGVDALNALDSLVDDYARGLPIHDQLRRIAYTHCGRVITAMH